MSSESRPEAFVRALAGLGAPAGAGSCLVIDGREEGLDAAVRAGLEPKSVVDAGPASVAEDARAVDLIVTSGVLGAGDLASAVSTVSALRARLAPGGALAAVIDCVAAPVSHPGVGRDDPILFPDLAALGLLGSEAERRTALTPAAWLALLARAGLKVEAVAGYGDEPPTPQTLADHGRRLEPFDPREIATGRLLVLARAEPSAMGAAEAAR